MHNIAKATIVVPVIIILIAVVLRFASTSYQSTVSDSTTISLSATLPTASPTSAPAYNKSALPRASTVKLNLKGPLACTYTDTDSDFKLFIQDRNVYAKFKSKEAINYVLVKGDCGYKWSDKEKEGIKMCNIGQYLSMVETFTSLPFFSPDLLLSFIPAFQGVNPEQSGASNNAISQLMSNCMKQSVNASLFDVPNTVQFVEHKITGSPENLLQKQK